MKNLYVVRYDDKYGNGSDTSLEVIVESKEDFLIWLDEHNAKREADGNEPESEDEFSLKSLVFFKK